MTYAERLAIDPELRDFVAAEIARAGIDVHASQVEAQHKDEVIRSLQLKNAELQKSVDAKKNRRV